MTNSEFVQDVLTRHGISAVIHFAGFKVIGESVDKPLNYYRNNLGGTISLLHAMESNGCRTLVFSSSAAVYGDPAAVPIAEDFPLAYNNPYGHTKLACEDILTSMRSANPAWRIATLRYFNPVGAHPNGLIGEAPVHISNNLMASVARVASGKLPHLYVYGSDYPTPDGTGVRDYLHVMDLAQGHVAALHALLGCGESFTVNLGTGRGHSVLEVVRAFEQASGQTVPYRFVLRRPGDVAQCYADASLAKHLLGWCAKYTLSDMCLDAWRWQKSNSNGFAQ